MFSAQNARNGSTDSSRGARLRIGLMRSVQVAVIFSLVVFLSIVIAYQMEENRQVRQETDQALALLNRAAAPPGVYAVAFFEGRAYVVDGPLDRRYMSCSETLRVIYDQTKDQFKELYRRGLHLVCIVVNKP